MGVWYVSRESVKAALDSKNTARNDAQIDRAIEAASRRVERLCHRKFYPTTTTRYFDYPNRQYANTWRLWLDSDEVISVSTLTAGGTTIAAADYFLEPVNDGPPYNRIEIDLDSAAAFDSGSTHQRQVAVTGVFGFGNEQAVAGALAEALDSSETGVDVTDSQIIGVGDTITVDSERMLVTGKVMKDTGQNSSTLTATKNDVSITGITTGSIAVGELLLVDSERMLVVDVAVGATDTLTVIRAYDGTVLASHSSGANLNAQRTLTVVRGALGTTAAAHDTAAAITKLVPPGPVVQLTVAYAIDQVEQETSGYARTVGSGENERAATGRAIGSLEGAVKRDYGRRRFGAI